MRDRNTHPHQDWFAAIESGNIERISEFMAREDFNINAALARGGTALMHAAWNGNIDVVRLLLDSGADIEMMGGNFNDPALVKAAKKDHIDVVRLLLDRGANIEATHPFHDYECGGTALMAAADKGYEDMVKLLLVKGADINRGHGLFTPLSLAARSGRTDMVKLLLDSGAYIENQGYYYSPLTQALNVDVVRLLLDSGANIEGKDEITGFTALMAAVDDGSIDVVRFLLDKGANVEVINDEVLQEALDNEDVDMLKIVIKWGAPPLSEPLPASYLQALQEAFDESLDESNTRAIENIFKYDVYVKLLELDEVRSKNAINYNEFTHTYEAFSKIGENKLGIITNHNIADDKEVSLAIKVLKGEPPINQAIKEVFGSGDLLNKIIEFVGFDRSLPLHKNLKATINNIKWSANEILQFSSFKSLRDSKKIKIINDEGTIINAFGQFYEATQGEELDIASLEKNILKQTCTLDDLKNSRATMDKFKDFMYLKGLATELGIKIEFYSKAYGLVSFGKSINQDISGVIIYKTENNEYIMSLEQAKVPLEQTKFPSISFNFADIITPLQYLNAGLDVVNKTIEADPDQDMQTIAEYAYIGYLSGGINNFNAYLSWDRLCENVVKGEYTGAFVTSLQLIVSAQISGLIDAYVGGPLSDAFKVVTLGFGAVYKANDLLSFEIDGQIYSAGEGSELFLSPL